MESWRTHKEYGFQSLFHFYTTALPAQGQLESMFLFQSSSLSNVSKLEEAFLKSQEHHWAASMAAPV